MIADHLVKFFDENSISHLQNIENTVQLKFVITDFPVSPAPNYGE